GEIVGRGLDDGLELAFGAVEVLQLDERAAERDARRDVARMLAETGAADVDGFLEAAGAPQLLGELRKRDRRRILLQASAKIIDARRIGHSVSYQKKTPGPFGTRRPTSCRSEVYWTVTCCVWVPFRP